MNVHGEHDTAELSDQVSAYQDRFKLRFKGHLENVYRRDFAERNRKYIQTGLWLVVVFYLLSGVIDWLLLKESVVGIWLGRYLIVAPTLFVIAVLSGRRRFRRLQQQIVFLVFFIACISMGYFGFVVQHESREFYFTGTLIILMAGLTISKLRFLYAAGLALVIPIVVLAMWFFSHGLAYEWVTLLYFFVCVNLVGVFTNYFFERASRREFLSKLLLNREQKNLQDANTHLRYLVSSDALTGIANRRHFDHMIEEECRRARRSQYPVSLLMIDIDYFKNYNDYYGHQQGDDCLKMVAKTIDGFAKRPGDLVARYGGEEFVMILSETTAEHGLELAESINAKVEALHIAHAKSTVSPYVTVSIGGATVIPHDPLVSEELVKLADNSLYRAKNSGRNRVLWSGEVANYAKGEDSAVR